MVSYYYISSNHNFNYCHLQKDAIHKRIADIAEAAGLAGVNVLCMQETFGNFAQQLCNFR